MHIDKSIQLLSADSGKQAADETGRQNISDAEAEFSELFGAELDYQEQQGAAGSDKKSGQEVAALLAKSAATAEQSIEGKLGSGAAVANAAKPQGPEGVVAGSTVDATDTQNLTVGQNAAAEQTSEPNLWLTIIGQSHDFNEILSRPPQVTLTTATMDNSALSAAEQAAAQLTGLATKDPVTIDPTTATGNSTATTTDGASNTVEDLLLKSAIADTDPQLALLNKTSADKVLSDKSSPDKESPGKVLSVNADVVKDPKSLSAEQTKIEINGLSDNTTVPQQPGISSTVQRSAQELVKVDQPSQSIPLGAATPKDKAKPDDRAPVMTDGTPRIIPEDSIPEQPTQLETSVSSRPTTATQMPQSAITIDSGINPVSQTEDKSGKLVGTLPIDVELPIDVVPDIQQLAPVIPAVPAAVASAGSSKTTPQTFAQFQKAANAAAVNLQKQQMQSELTQGQPAQELAAQQSPRFAELSQTLPGTHADTPIAFNTLLQTERPISSSGGNMGSSTGQQQQQAASQLFATRLNDSVHSNDQPALSLLEPNAATQLKERVMFQINQKIQSAEIKLAPEELGSMQIKVQLQQEQLSVQFVVQQAGAKEALEQQMPRLREMLEEQGMQLTDGQVSQQREGSDDQKQARQRHQVAGQGVDIDDEPLQQQAIVRVSDRMVDYYA